MGIALAAMLAVCTVADLRSRVVPNRALAAGAAAAVVLTLVCDPGSLGPRVLAAIGAGGFLLAPALLSPGSMGMGDVKLAAVLGLYLGAAVAFALLVAFLAGTVTGGVLVLRHGRAARKMAIPFVPYMALGAAIAAL
jgi:leader peptidase (prepilin peptidase)/N-methyltransferase